MPHDLSRLRIQKQAAVAGMREVEHMQQRAGELIVRVVPDAAQGPIVLDKAQHGRLIGQRAVHEILLGKQRNYQQGQARSIAATARDAIGIRTPTLAGRIQAVLARGGLLHDGTHHVIIPAIRIVPGNDHGHVFPLGQGLQGVDGIDQEELFIQWGRIPRMLILRLFGLQKADGGELTCGRRIPEIGEVVLMVGLVRLADHLDRTRRQVDAGWR